MLGLSYILAKRREGLLEGGLKERNLNSYVTVFVQHLHKSTVSGKTLKRTNGTCGILLKDTSYFIYSIEYGMT